jgi:hypothetical protein
VSAINWLNHLRCSLGILSRLAAISSGQFAAPTLRQHIIGWPLQIAGGTKIGHDVPLTAAIMLDLSQALERMVKSDLSKSHGPSVCFVIFFLLPYSQGCRLMCWA